MDLSTWLAFAVLETFLCLTPGPAVMFVVGTALGRGRRAGFVATAGIVTANTIYFVLSATSLGAILLTSYQLFAIVRWAGAAYLILIGVRALLARQPRLGALPAWDARKSYAGATITQLSNPKALVFFSALLPQFINPHRSLFGQMIVFGVTSQLIEALVMTAYILAASGVVASARKTRITGVFERIAGVFLIGAALKLAFTKRT